MEECAAMESPVLPETSIATAWERVLAAQHARFNRLVNRMDVFRPLEQVCRVVKMAEFVSILLIQISSATASGQVSVARHARFQTPDQANVF
jgi:hypothetical protein